MSYRDDRDADRARIEALEVELVRAQRKLVALEQPSVALVPQGGNALAVQRGEGVPWYGAPLRLELSRRFEGALSPDRFEDLIDAIRRHTRESGRSELLKSSMTWSTEANPKSAGPFWVVTISIRHGHTDLVVTDRLGQLAGAIYGGVGGGVGGGGISVPIMVPLAMAMPALIPVFCLGWLGTAFLGTRALFKNRAKSRARRLQALFEAVASEIASALQEAARPPVAPGDHRAGQ